MSFRMLRLVGRPVVTSLALARQKLFSPKCLLYTNTGLTVCLSISGDILQQWYQSKAKQIPLVLDKTRMRNIACTGFLIGPFLHFWYIFLDRRLPARTFTTLCKKVLLDQLISTPIYLSLFMFSLCYMEKKTLEQIKTDIAEKGSVLYLAELCIWPPFQFINFYFLPTRYRVLFDNSISFGFDCFWSYVWYDKDKKEEVLGCAVQVKSSEHVSKMKVYLAAETE